MNDYNRIGEIKVVLITVSASSASPVSKKLHSMFEKLQVLPYGILDNPTYTDWDIIFYDYDNSSGSVVNFGNITDLKTLCPNAAMIVIGHGVPINTTIKLMNAGLTYFVNGLHYEEELEQSVNRALDVVLKNRKKLNADNELRVLRKKIEYSEEQESIAMRKKKYYTVNNFRHRYFVSQSGDRWFVDHIHKSIDIMNGDSYSIHRLADNRIFIFLSDAMGKGLGASLTSIIFTTYVTHLITISPWIELQDLVSKMCSYMKSLLLDEELFCTAIVMLDMNNNTLEYANFGMPKILLNDLKKEGVSLPSNNPPITKYSPGQIVDSVSIAGVSKIFICSDGIIDLSNGEAYFGDVIEEYFKESKTMGELCQRFEADFPITTDDKTAIMLAKEEVSESILGRITVDNKQSNLAVLEQFLMDTIAPLKIEKSHENKLMIAFNEAILNAYEHGNLGLKLIEKHNALNHGNYNELLAMKEQSEINLNKTIILTIGFYNGSSDILKIEIEDSGNGFAPSYSPIKTDPMLLCGRGIEIMKEYTDQLYYSKKGNVVMFLIHLKGS